MILNCMTQYNPFQCFMVSSLQAAQANVYVIIACLEYRTMLNVKCMCWQNFSHFCTEASAALVMHASVTEISVDAAANVNLIGILEGHVSPTQTLQCSAYR